MTDPLTIIRQTAPRLGLDPAAVVAYALTQGGVKWGAVGDNGSSFGPFQAHIGGAAGRRSPQQASQWANSPQGLTEMMGMMARAGATGRKGPDAAAYIVGPSFGRGANPPRDMANARAQYTRALQLVGGAPTGAGSPPPTGQFPRGNAMPVQQGIADNPAAKAALMAQIMKIGHGGSASSLLPVLDLMRQAPTSPSGAASAASAAASPPIPAGGGGSTTSDNPGTIHAPLLSVAKQFGLTITSGYRSVERQAQLYAHRSRDGSVAAPGKSYHNFGRAIDIAVNPSAMRFLHYAKQHPSEFKEVFYDPAGWYIKNGKIVQGSIGGHSDHVHLAI